MQKVCCHKKKWQSVRNGIFLQNENNNHTPLSRLPRHKDKRHKNIEKAELYV
jgi:hypothetical protein